MKESGLLSANREEELDKPRPGIFLFLEPAAYE